MALEELKYIAQVIDQENKNIFDRFGVNGIQLPSGQIIKFTDNREKEYIGLSDCIGTAFYIRTLPAFNIQEGRRFTSCEKNTLQIINCKLVAFDFTNKLNSEKLGRKLLSDLQKIGFDMKSKPEIVIKKGNLNYMDVFTEETKKNPPEEMTCIAIEFDLRLTTNVETCDCESVFYIPEIC